MKQTRLDHVTVVLCLCCVIKGVISARIGINNHLYDKLEINEGYKGGEPWIETLSWSPRSFLYHNFLSDEEATHIKSLAKPLMHRSTVVGNKGQDIEDGIRTSYGTFISRLQDPIISKIEDGIAWWTKLNVSHQEDMQVLRYSYGQKYGAHYDSLLEDTPRLATVLLYLSDVEEGGETAFPQSSSWVDPSLPKQLGPFSKCAEGKVATRPKKGDALLFFSLRPDGTSDPAALHTGCPVIRGTKWTGTVWIHTAPFRPSTLGDILKTPRLPDECEDYSQSCESWAKNGECEKNKKFMEGDAFNIGECRKACGTCEPCSQGDRACMSRNRVRGGYLSLDELDDDK